MTIDELKATVETYRDGLKEKQGACFFNEAGPIAITLIDAVVQALDAQQNQIEELKSQIAMRRQSDHTLSL